MHALRERLVAHELEARPDLARFHPREVRASLLRAWLDVELGRIGDRAFAEGFARACPRNDAPPEAYWPRVLEGTPTLLAGIRFKGGDRAQPFVELRLVVRRPGVKAHPRLARLSGSTARRTARGSSPVSAQ